MLTLIPTAAWTQIPRERFNADAFWSANKSRRNVTNAKGAHFLRQDPGLYDAGFFGVPGAEAAAIDPQQRMITEVAYEALESAGLSLPGIAGSRTSVYVGNFTHDYKVALHRDPDGAPKATVTGTQMTSMAGRLSWLWDLRGPSFGLDTACSSSMVALHLACQSLRGGESDMAIVGGTNLMLSHEVFRFATNQGFLGADGRSKAFDESADGYGRGEGVAAVIVKRVRDAVRDRDPIRAVIRGSACNHDGRTTGLTLPSAEAQMSLIREAYNTAGLDMRETRYIEAHGTGTQAGDKEETTAIFGTLAAADIGSGSRGDLLIGSVKSNVSTCDHDSFTYPRDPWI